jgi:hypothetical protein
MTGLDRSAVDTRVRIIHGAMLSATIAVPVILAVVRVSVGQTGTEQPARVLAVLALTVALIVVLVSFSIRKRIPDRGQTPAAEWWTIHMRSAVVLWGLAEGTGMLAGVSYFLTGQLPATLLAFGVAVVLLLRFSPARLAE